MQTSETDARSAGTLSLVGQKSQSVRSVIILSLYCSHTIALIKIRTQNYSDKLIRSQVDAALLVAPIKPSRSTCVSLNLPMFFLFSRPRSFNTHLSKTNQLLQLPFVTLLEPLRTSRLNSIIIFCVTPLFSTIY
jgi:hypothetical protein